LFGAFGTLAFFARNRAARATSGVAFVDGAVAVVVFSVAGLGFGVGVGDACHGTAFALSGAFGALAFFAGNRAAPATGGAFIDGAVAVVVLAITSFGGGLDLSCTCAPRALTASALSILASAFSAGGSWAGVAGLGDVFVDLSIAIVIEIVTNFFSGCFGFCVALDVGFGGVADVLSGLFALAFASRAGFVFVGPGFVDLAIAVVIDTITDFVGGFDLAGTGAPLAVFAGLDTT
jgi:hypothetical protein